MAVDHPPAGDMDEVLNNVMCSRVEDEARFAEMVLAALKEGRAQPHEAFTSACSEVHGKGRSKYHLARHAPAGQRLPASESHGLYLRAQASTVTASPRRQQSAAPLLGRGRRRRGRIGECPLSAGSPRTSFGYC
jgi:hypothetical protein